MKFSTQVVTLSLLNALAVTSAFSVHASIRSSSLALQSSKQVFDDGFFPAQDRSSSLPTQVQGGDLAPYGDNERIAGITLASDLDMFPIFPTLQRMQGGGAVQTFQMPHWAERCQMFFMTDGRPMKATAELWLGPQRTTHTLKIDVEDGNKTPVQTTLKFKKANQVLKITTTDSLEFPLLVGVHVPSPERSNELMANTEKLWKNSPPEIKQKVQGGPVGGGDGANRYWQFPPHVESVQLLAWSKDVGAKSLKVEIEVLQGPDNVKQSYFLQCGGGSQPYHAVFQTPGPGCAIRVKNKKFLEDGLTEVMILPYEESSLF